MPTETAEDLMQAAAGFAQSGDTDRYKSTLREVIERYPDSQAATKARMVLGATAPKKAGAFAPTNVQHVRVVDLDIEFGTMVVFFIKAGLAAIPALIILSVVGFLISAVVVAFLGLSLR